MRASGLSGSTERIISRKDVIEAFAPAAGFAKEEAAIFEILFQRGFFLARESSKASWPVM